jgi:hypothetical protein
MTVCWWSGPTRGSHKCRPAGASGSFRRMMAGSLRRALCPLAKVCWLATQASHPRAAGSRRASSRTLA